MKKLEELGISPAPWECVKAINAECGRSLIVRACKGGELPTLLPQNARLIAAAPELYEALRLFLSAFEEIRQSAWFIDANFHEIMQLNKVMKSAEAALAKAAGESEVKL